VHTTGDHALDGSMKYCLLTPAELFLPLVKRCRAIVFAGGTMHPVSHLIQQLLPSVPAARITTLTCKHVVPKENVLALCVPRYPSGAGAFRFSFDRRGDDEQVDQLGLALFNVTTVIPAGIVCFFPSYDVEARVWKRWGDTGRTTALGSRTKVTARPRRSNRMAVGPR
jgi:chromosome transmission fidelity protein 1